MSNAKSPGCEIPVDNTARVNGALSDDAPIVDTGCLNQEWKQGRSGKDNTTAREGNTERQPAHVVVGSRESFAKLRGMLQAAIL